MKDYIYTSLHIQQFRSYADFAVDLSPGVNIVVGPNGCGKTNLLEAILIVSGFPSFRAHISELLQHEKDWARIDIGVLGGERILRLEKRNEAIDKTYEINGNKKKRPGFSDIVPTIVFEPEHMRLLTGSPEHRRDFFDQMLAETEANFSSLKNQYKRTLAQRNSLLKQNSVVIKSQIFAWDVRLSELAGKLVASRQKLVTKLNEQLERIYGEIAGKENKVVLQYETKLPIATYETSLLAKLEQNLHKDIERGFTTYGPHRDDFLVLLDDQPAEHTASRGETRTLVLSLKILEIKIIEEARLQKPLILLDDVFSELDGARRKALTNYLKDYQTIITTTDADLIVKEFAQKCNIIGLY